MAKFFIDRPIFAWVIAIFICVIGTISITQLPIAQYPPVAPPAIVVSAVYPGASAQTLEESVLAVIEREMNGATGLLYMESSAQSNGTGSLTITFKQGTDPALAQVDVQNRLASATPRLPSVVTQQGVTVTKSSGDFLLFAMLASDNPEWDVIRVGDYAARNVVPELQRVEGVGQVQLFGSEQAMRVWIDPSKLEGFKLSPSDVLSAIRGQNAQVSSGAIGEQPSIPGQAITATVIVPGQLSTVEAFNNIILRASTDGATVRLQDVARVEIGGQSYGTSGRLNGRPAAGIGVQLSPTGNALAASKNIREKMEQLQQFFPEGMSYSIPYDSSKFVSISITKVTHTLIEAVVLVFLVMFLFLQNWRYTLIPTIVVPVALLGTFATLLALGFSINVLTMFGMVLVIGIVVDDAIVVVENVERIMSEEGLAPIEATRKAMGQISGAIIGVTVVLVSVFIPLAFFSGSTGNIYRQFAAVMVASISFSAFMALSLTPALCASLLKPVQAGHHLEGKGFFAWFNRSFAKGAKRYEGAVSHMLHRAARYMLIYVAIIGAVAVIYNRLPTAFLPNEDQGSLLVNVQLPAGATSERTQAVMEQLEKYVLAQPEVTDMVSVIGFSFSGQGQNAALGFISLKNWDERPLPSEQASAVANRIMGATAGIRDAIIFALSPPPIPSLGTSAGFEVRLQDRAGLSHDALVNARNMFLGLAAKSPILAQVRPDGLEDAPQIRIDIDREKANALGVTFESINSVLSTSLGSAYVNDFPNRGRMQRVMVQADTSARMQPSELLKLNASNSSGSPVALSNFATITWAKGAQQSVRYNGYPAMKITGSPAPGYSTGEAMNEVARLMAQLPEGFGYEWTGQSLQEQIAGSQSIVLYSFAILAVFLCLAALYESWSIPLSVILVVPLGVLGVLLATLLRNYSNDIYFQIGLITVIGLSAKNAILIIEFAKDLQAEGKDMIAAALEAAHLRFRPIIMTSLAFGLGVVPLAIATGASSASQRAIGTSVLGGMVTGTLLAVFFVPVFFVVVRRFFAPKAPKTPTPPQAPTGTAGADSHA